MALSGTFTGSFHGGHYRLVNRWTATQNIDNNTSTITVRSYLETDRYWSIYYSATKSGNTTIDGQSDNWSSSSNVSDNGGGSHYLNTTTRTVSHDSDGGCTINLSAWFDVEVTIAGTWHGRVSASDTVTLNTIPRASSMTTSRNFTAGSNRTISISRASSAFRHEVEISVKRRDGVYDWIKRVAFSTSQTSLSTSFSTAESTQIFNHLDGRSSADVRMTLQTFRDSTHIGTKDYYGTVSAPSASSPNGSFDHYVYVDQTISGTLSRANSNFTHTVRMKLGSYTKTITGVGSSFSWTPSASEQDALYNQMPNDRIKNGEIEVDTFYSGEKVRSTTSQLLQFHVRNSDPTFSSNQISYQDVNSATVALTENDQYIIQGKSTLRAYVNSAATPKNGASIDKYVVSVAGISNTIQTIGYTTIGVINADKAITLSVKAIDSRGLSTTVTKTVIILPYLTPNIASSATRKNGFETTTTLTLSGSYDGLNVGGTRKNALQAVRYRYRQRGNAAWSAWDNFAYTTSGTTFVANDKILTLDNTQAWDIQVQVVDKLGNKVVVKQIDKGRPVFYMDADKNSIGFNDLPTSEDEFLVNGRIRFGTTLWSGSTGGGLGAIELNNSDITGTNGIWFNDYASDNNAEGLLFLKSGAESGSDDKADYDNLLVSNGAARINGKPISVSPDQAPLWSGVYFMYGSQSLRPKKRLLDCANGWVFVWSDYDPAEGVTNDYNWAYTFIPKKHASLNGTSTQHMFSGGSTFGVIHKELYISNTTVSGKDTNDDASNDDAVLRYVYEW